ncbi:MAG: polysaccharide deacetylase family protein [Cyclobacteriaceae bacterium]|nr:polysaccharide deacetylase family protein [Cyclobacteriaceae bacterium]
MLKYIHVKLFFAILLVIMLGLDMYGVSFSNYWYGIVVLFFLLFVATGSYFIQWNFFLESSNNGNPNSNEISLTFDDGPHETLTPKVLKLLDEFDAKATFFCIGKKVKYNQVLVNEIINKGHSVGNHSYAHQHNFPILSVNKMIDEIEKTNILIENNNGKRLFRPPFGITNPRIARAVKKTKMKTIGWNVRSYDTIGDRAEKVVQRVMKKMKGGAIILLHDDRDDVVQILEGILQFMKKQNLKSVKVEDLLKI